MIKELVDSPGFFYGSGGRYTLVDSLRYQLLLVSDDPTLLLAIKKLFESKRNLAVVNMPEFHNVDNSVVLNWKIRKFRGKDLFPGKGSLVLTTWEPFVSSILQRRPLEKLKGVFNLGDFVLLEESVSIDDVDIDLVKQMFIAAKFFTMLSGFPIPLTIDEMQQVEKEFSVSLTCDDLINNVHRLANAWYVNGRAHGALLFNSIPREYLYE